MEAKRKYKEWYLAHQASKFMGYGEIAIAEQQELKKLIKNKDFIDKYDLQKVNFKKKAVKPANPQRIK